MYHENIARFTANHLRSHIKSYLDIIAAEYTGELSVPLIVPKRIDYNSAVGGMINEFAQILPEYGIDVLNKIPGQSDASLWIYEYIGQLNGLVDGGSREAVDLQIARHARAVEMFIRAHKTLHQQEFTGFSLVEFIFVTTEWSGAEYLGTAEDRDIWIAGFSTNVSWITSEEGPEDHG